ncbi:MAG: glycosyltransferase family 9 protein [Terrimicrobiaceae bacterium]
MKITVSSPDGLGDFILRTPMIRALAESGHELQLLMRRPALDLAAAVFPKVRLLEIGADPYHPDTRRKRNPFRSEQSAIRSFRPDLYVASLFALNFFDEVWFENDRWRLPVAGFSTRDAFWPSGTIADPAGLSENFRIRVEVPVTLPELEKNRLLGSAILGNGLSAVSPSLAPGEESLAAAREILRLHGLTEGAYWIACVGSRSGLAMKDWGEANWRAFFSAVLPEDGRPVVFLGNPKESESIERIRSGGFRSVNLASDPPPVPVSLVLASMSCGYAGRDSGVMHLASAAGRPVLAVYGGAHWGRFLPSSGPAVVTTCSVTCCGCDFACPYERPWCIADVGFDTMSKAWERLPLAAGVEIIEQAAGPEREILPSAEALRHANSVQIERRRREQTERGKSLPERLADKIFSRAPVRT